MKHKVTFAAALALLLIGLSSHSLTQHASAVPSDGCYQSGTLINNGDIIAFGTPVDCVLTSDSGNQRLEVAITDPNGPFFDVFVDTNAAGQSANNSVPSLNIPGHWQAHFVKCFLDNSICQETTLDFTTNFFVTPESPIGAIAMLVSSLGAFGGYMFLRQRRITNL